jgi:glycosyltransferase involved in cell wall biosynthesis
MVLQRLAERHEVTLLVVPLYAPIGPVPPALATLCREIVVQHPMVGPASNRGWWERIVGRRRRERAHFGETAFDVVHVFRLAAVPLARPYFRAAGRLQLDLDDIESLTHRRLAALYQFNGDAMRAKLEERLAERLAAVEDETLPEFDSVFVCSDADRERLLARCHPQVLTLRNAVRLPGPTPPRSPDGPFRFLFAGTLGYYPNADAARYFCLQVQPVLRQMAPGDFTTTIVGNAPSDEVRRLAAEPGVCVAGPVPDMAPWYGEADAVVVPIRAGGGTRIKVLEAFSYRRPVVSTTLGVEGIDVRHDEHLLIGDTPETFAEECCRLMADPALAHRLVEGAYSLLIERYVLLARSDEPEALPGTTRSRAHLELIKETDQAARCPLPGEL